MRTVLIAVVLAAICGGAHAQMTDDRIIDYVSEGIAAGKSERQLGRELLARGVSMEQLRRLESRFSGESVSESAGRSFSAALREERTRSETPAGIRPESSSDDAFSASGKPVYGRSLFNSPLLSFEPNENASTPEDYKLGAGDEIIIDIWGANEECLRRTISPEGDIMVSQIGPVYLAGLTIKEASDKVRRSFSQKYGGVGGDEPSSEVRLSLGQMRTIRVNVMGEVAVPGTYRLSAFSTLFHALYNAGGITDIGSLRNIRVIRGGRCVAEADIYEYIFEGRPSGDIRLQEEDVIVVPPYGILVEAEGEFKRPMRYELRSDETLADLIFYAGGLTGKAYGEEMRVVRGTGRVHTMLTVSGENYSSTVLEDGDSVTVGAILDRFDNRVSIRGAVYRDGAYELGDRIRTVRDLVEAADGVRDDAFLSRALLTRRKDDCFTETLPIYLEGILNGTCADVALRPDDVLEISSTGSITERGALVIRGPVNSPGSYPYSENMTIKDLILKADGLQDGAATVQIEIARRTKSPASTESSGGLGEVFLIDLNSGLEPAGDDFVLEPYDVVQVRRSPAYNYQRNVRIEGEVVFAGDYSLVRKNERLSDLVVRAGGITDEAYARGARLIRRMNADEKSLRDATLHMALRNAGRDSISLERLDLSDTDYTVGIELDKALENPGSDYDMVLREGDCLVIPENVSTVSINGAVMHPNTVLYHRGKRLSYYISMAGGYANRAKRSKAYIIYMNGTVSRVSCSRGARMMEPGCEIIVPSRPERDGLRLAEILAIASTAGSLGTMSASIANLIRIAALPK